MRFRLRAWIGVAALALSACTTLQPVETAQKMMGSPQDSVRQAFGEPTDTFQRADGTQRWIYSKQPYGYEIYAADFDAGGRLSGFRQMLTENEVYTARPGTCSLCGARCGSCEDFYLPCRPPFTPS